MTNKIFKASEQVKLSGFYYPHDKYQIELKLDSKMNKNKNNYLLETYLFIPKSLEVKSRLNDPEEYFKDIKSYMRYSTPDISLTELLSTTSKVSPIKRINRMISFKDYSKLAYELKMLVCVFKKSANKQIKHIANINDIKHSFKLITGVNSQFKLINLRISNREINSIDIANVESVKECYYYTTNYLLTKLLKRCIKFGYNSSSDIYNEINDMLTKNWFIGNSSSYPLLSNDEDLERYVYRESKLKKFSNKIMHLNRAVKGRGGAEEILYGVAAGGAMLFAVIATIISLKLWPMASWPWITVAVVAYVVKDRMKAWLQNTFSNIIPKYLSHRTEKIIDAEFDTVVGKVKEWISFKEPTNIPEDIELVRLYNRENTEAFPKEEDVLYYKKELNINSKKVNANHSRVDMITNILRFNVNKFCIGMDDPYKLLTRVDKDGNVSHIDAKKVYHLNLIIKITTNYKHKDETSEKLNLRIIMSRDGIERIETPYRLDNDNLFDVE